MFFATAGRGTESFLASEIKDKLKAKISFRDGKVFFNKEGINPKELRTILSLKVAERVFVSIADYDNSAFIYGRRKFLDKIMTQLSGKGMYAEADALVKKTNDIICSQREHFDWESKTLQEKNLAKDKTERSEPEEKRARLEVLDCGSQHKDEPKASAESNRVLSEATYNDHLTFRMSIKCSGRLKKRLDIKRLSHDIGWRIEQASGWKIELRKPNIEVCVHINDEHVTVGVPLTRQPLSQRHYIQDSGLRAPVAWIMCYLADIQSGDIVMDPMCGKATVLLEGFSNWQDAFYLGSDISQCQTNSAVQNIAWSGLRIRGDICVADGLNMPYRNCSADVILCDAPFNQNHVISSTPTMFYKSFLQQIHRVLKPEGRCVLLVSEELISEILTQVLNSMSAGEKINDTGQIHPEVSADSVVTQQMASCDCDDSSNTLEKGAVNFEKGSLQRIHKYRLMSSTQGEESHKGASVAQWLASPLRDLQGAFYYGFEPYHRRLSPTEGPKA
ncbi:THUMP domain-containing protein 2 [Plakobranchus ocellatus]|uniref:THUMP domain-containing protein 2 n=1 Tax=Plakobranchus ocellatus TaxID=259542 RepID=A0AAV4DX71_9GAST|nr:THUMP domain-containing protein 2 [Plakobranchus ocellatus]